VTDPSDELIEQLRAANPVPASQTTGRRASPEADALLARARRGHVRPRRTVLIAAVIALALLLIAALSGFFVLRRGNARSPGTVQCLTSGDLRSRRIVVAGANPRAACAALWREGRLGHGPVPHFAICTDRSAALVIPGESGTTCVQLGVAVAETDHETIARFAVDLSARLQYGCTKEQDARTLATDRLRVYGLTDWQVTVSTDAPFGPARPCASIAVDSAHRRVILIAIANNRER
jgi:hypothetical protein